MQGIRFRIDAGRAALGESGFAGDRTFSALADGLAVELGGARSIACAAMLGIPRNVGAAIATPLEPLVAHDLARAVRAHGLAVLGRRAGAPALAAMGERRVEIHAFSRAVRGAARARIAAPAPRAHLAERAARVALSAVSGIAENVHALAVAELESLAALDAAGSGLAHGGAVRHGRAALAAPAAILGIRVHVDAEAAARLEPGGAPENALSVRATGMAMRRRRARRAAATAMVWPLRQNDALAVANRLSLSAEHASTGVARAHAHARTALVTPHALAVLVAGQPREISRQIALARGHREGAPEPGGQEMHRARRAQHE